ncbi:phosphoenolpyruvate--protein phosphotransferase [Sporosarcina sp.]|uniref:phosphoenolpyruvate--protein phosphotransferase n=1 Tax=Sporosarcina sp. TaxID=49982 RepID=UPI0026204BA6|nr:phosphoenolpyruvate--protein phosphotransferase [Sporosarcina sp.]
MKQLHGIAASRGIAIAKAYCLVESDLQVEKKTVADIPKEIERFQSALAASKEELEAIREKAEKEMGVEEAAIFNAQILVSSDPELIDSVENNIKENQLNAESSLEEIANQFITMLEQLDNEYMRERASDIRDVTKRILSHLLDVKVVNLSMINEEVIMIANDLTPSDTAQLNRQFVKAFVTNIGGRTSHSAIMARSMEIPAVVGAEGAVEQVRDGDLVIVDGVKGEVHINPSEDVVAAYKQQQKEMELEKKELEKLLNEKTVTADGEHIELAANIGTPADLAGVKANGAEGIGLYRTEFLYMDRDQLPTEEEQFTAYKKVLEEMNGLPVVVRTLDVGGDKELPYLQLPKEMNPFLGLRAVRLCLKEQEMFRTQLRALLRASKFGSLKIMFPMIATIDEFRHAKSILEEEKQKLVSNNIEVADNIEVGIMVEIPSTAVQADVFAKEVDFFSIGTNDLIQYTMAADRMNETVSYLYQPCNPAILRLVKMVIDAAHNEGKIAGMCGEMAGDETAIPLLLGLGLDEFSMSASSILKSRKLISQLKMSDMKELANEAVGMATAEEVVNAVMNRVQTVNI